MPVEANKALSKTKIALMNKPEAVFFSSLCLSMNCKWDDTCPIAYTDYKSIAFNTQFFMELSPSERISLLLHETMHVAYMHNLRVGNKDRKVWNFACDYVINLQIKDAGFTLPKIGLIDEKYRDMSAEEVYDLLMQNPTSQPSPSQGMDDLRDSPEEPTEEEIAQITQEMQDNIIRAATQARMEDQAGSIPGAVQVFLNKLLQPKLPWQVILSRFMNKLTKTDYTWSKRNRRYPDVYLPAMHSQTLMDIAIAWDMSGSVSDDETTAFASEVASVLRNMKPDKLTLVQFDTKVFQVNKLKTVKDLTSLTLKGRGGTDLHDLVKWTHDNRPQVNIVFTDGYFHMPEEKLYGQTIWIIHNNLHFTAPYGKVIHYKV